MACPWRSPAFLPAAPVLRTCATDSLSRRTTRQHAQPICTASPGRVSTTMPHPDIKRLGKGKRFNQVVVHDGVVYLAGQVARGTDGSAYAETAAILKKIDGLLAQAGTDKSRMLSATIWMSDISGAPEMNRAWDEWVDPENMPARATVQAALVANDISIEIQATAALPSPARTLATSDAAPAVGAYNQGIVVDNGTVYISGCIGLTTDGGTELIGRDVEAETVQALSNMRAILKDAGATPNDIVKTTILLDDIADFGKVNGIYEAFFKGGRVPARSCFAAKKLPKGALVEIEAIATLSRT